MEKIFTSFENSFDELFSLESIILLTKEACLEREFASIYYDLPSDTKTNLSKERNHYINMLTLAQDKITNLKNIITSAEKEIYLQQDPYDCCRKVTA